MLGRTIDFWGSSLCVRLSLFCASELSALRNFPPIRTPLIRYAVFLVQAQQRSINNSEISNPLQRDISGGRKRRVTIACSVIVHSQLPINYSFKMEYSIQKIYVKPVIPAWHTLGISEIPAVVNIGGNNNMYINEGSGSDIYAI